MEQPNLNYIKNLADGDVDFENNMLAILKSDFITEKLAFNNSFSSNDYTEAANVVHKMKQKLSILGLEEDFETATIFEKNLKENDISLYEKFSKILDKIHVYLKSK